MILRVLAQFFAAVQIQIFSKISDFIFGQKWHILGQKQPFFDYFHIRAKIFQIKVGKQMIVEVLSQFFAVVQIKIFSKISDFIFGQKWPILDQKQSFLDYFHIRSKIFQIKVGKLMIVEVLAQFFFCRSNENIIKNLGFQFWSKMAHFRSKIAIFGLFSYKGKNIPS